MSKLYELLWKLLSPIRRLLHFLWRILKNPLRGFTALLRIIWYLFPAFIFLLATWAVFWQLSQGKDVLIDMLEKKYAGGFVLLAVLFWSMVTWYSSRILVYRKKILYEENEELAFHLPRLMGFLGFSIVWIALLRLPKDAYLHVHIKIWMAYALLGVSFIAYFILYNQFKIFRDNTLRIDINENTASPSELETKNAKEKKRFRIVYILMGCIAAGLLMLNSVVNKPMALHAWLMFVSVILLQLVFLFTVVIRRGRVPFKNKEKDVYEMPLDFASVELWQQAEAKKGNHFTIGIWERILYSANIPVQEKWFFIVYNIITILSLIVYFTTISTYSFAVAMGSFTTVLIAFGVLVGFFCAVTFASVVLRVNLHMALWILVIVLGKIFEPHWATIINYKDNSVKVFDTRPSLYSYFDKWVQQRRVTIEKDSTPYPVFFVLADGGASRSGYWTASVLGKLEDTTNGKFSQHLFCLSGASGGSVGNGTFLSLLKYRSELAAAKLSFAAGAQQYLRSDFLTYTLARTLGPDFLRPIIPLPFINDRAAALEDAMEQGETSFLSGKFKDSLSQLIPFSNNNTQLPMLCVNATRMQDGRPAVISTVSLDRATVGERLDILRTLPAGKDMKLSTAVVMGARFPYLSPAGRIDSSYYVDGGYFDNSGAGVVNEMITGLKKYIDANSATQPYLNKLRFYIIHAQNGWPGGGDISKVHPIVNDLAAPVLTMLGAYGSQTSVNDWRLIKYMESIYQNKNDTGYMAVNLYRRLTDSSSNAAAFPMNWVISDYYIEKMNTQLYNVDMKRLVAWLRRKL
jgi:predicted acylesterase/phospholipase RssA